MPRRKRSAEEQERRGNPGRRKLVVAPAAALPVLEIMPPDHMSDDGKAVWHMVAPDLIAMKILRRTDAIAFAVFCETFAEYCKALKQLRREGTTYEAQTTVGGKLRRINPRYAIVSRARRDLLEYAAKFGLTPTDRFRVITHLAGGTAHPPDPRGGARVHDDDESALLDLDADADPLSDAGPVGALN